MLNKILAILIFLMLILPVTVAYCMKIKQKERLACALANLRHASRQNDKETGKLKAEIYKLKCELEDKQSELDDAHKEIERFNVLLKDVKLAELEVAE